MVLADLGADVIKVERPGAGDETRGWGPPHAGGESAYYLSINRSKRSCALDLKDERAREMAAELLYYLRDEPIPLYVWPSGPSPSDQYEMTRAFTAGAPEPILFVSLKRCPESFAITSMKALSASSATSPRSASRIVLTSAIDLEF